ncbi:hypothetical protein GCM10020001_080630 [Nonomuraea salmonea]
MGGGERRGGGAVAVAQQQEPGRGRGGQRHHDDGGDQHAELAAPSGPAGRGRHLAGRQLGRGQARGDLPERVHDQPRVGAGAGMLGHHGGHHGPERARRDRDRLGERGADAVGHRPRVGRRAGKRDVEGGAE